MIRSCGEFRDGWGGVGDNAGGDEPLTYSSLQDCELWRIEVVRWDG
jgi:hypothetical protein